MGILFTILCIVYLIYKLSANKINEHNFNNKYGDNFNFLNSIKITNTNVDFECKTNKLIMMAYKEKNINLIDKDVVETLSKIYGNDRWINIFLCGDANIYNRERCWISSLILAKNGLINSFDLFNGFLTYVWCGEDAEILSEKYYKTLTSVLNKNGVPIKLIYDGKNKLKIYNIEYAGG